MPAIFARRLIRTKFAAIVNILAGRAVVPELIQQDSNPVRLAEEIGALLGDPVAAAAQRAAFARVMGELRPEGGVQGG